MANNEMEKKVETEEQSKEYPTEDMRIKFMLVMPFFLKFGGIFTRRPATLTISIQNRPKLTKKVAQILIDWGCEE